MCIGTFCIGFYVFFMFKCGNLETQLIEGEKIASRKATYGPDVQLCSVNCGHRDAGKALLKITNS